MTHLHYVAGDRFMMVDVEGMRCTLFVCYDLRLADEMWATAKDTR
jgi:predicted amidohydrolase